MYRKGNCFLVAFSVFDGKVIGYAANEALWPISEVWNEAESFPENVTEYDGLDDVDIIDENEKILDAAEIFIDQNKGGISGVIE